MSDFWRGAAWATAITLFTIFGLLTFVPSARERALMREAIEHNAARYHPQTGEFEWIENRSSTESVDQP